MNRNHRWLPPAVLLAISLAALMIIPLNGCGGRGGSSKSTSSASGSPSITPIAGTTPIPALPVNTGTVTAQTGWNIDSPAYVQATKQWTVLVYMNGANNLESFANINANQMEAVGSSTNVNIILQFKRAHLSASDGDDTSDGDWAGTRRFYVTQDTNTTHVSSTILSDNATLDMGSPDSLQAFIQWGIKTYPAQHYCLVIWNHGAGWRSEKLVTRAAANSTGLTRGISYDDEYNTHIDTTQIPAAIDMGGGKKWDLLAFDASLMQMAEVDYQIKDEVQYIVGSEESPPGLGYPYHLWMNDLEYSPSFDGKALGIDIAAQTMTFYQGSTEPWSSNDWGPTDITQSVIDASKMAAIAPAVDSLGSALMGAKQAYGTAISNDRNSSLNGLDSYDYPENKDLLDFTRLLALKDPYSSLTVTNNSTVKSAIAAVNSAVAAAVLYNTHGTDHSGSNGLAILLTDPATYSEIDSDQASGDGPGNGSLRYSQLAFAIAAPNWQNFLVNGPP